MEPRSHYLEIALLAAARAGRIVRDGFRRLQKSEIAEKSAHDFVTRVDMESEAVIVAAISEACPSHGIVAEESEIASTEAEYCWVIDPLDGTANYIRGLPICAISIALLREHVPQIGLVYDPFKEETFSASLGEGAFLNGAPISVSERKALAGAFGATGFPFKSPATQAGYLAAFAALVPMVCDMRRCGSAALDLAYTACGIYDFFWESHLLPWDFLGAELIVREAGGVTSDFFGRQLGLGSRTVLAAAPGLYGELAEVVGAHFPPPALQ